MPLYCVYCCKKDESRASAVSSWASSGPDGAARVENEILEEDSIGEAMVTVKRVKRLEVKVSGLMVVNVVLLLWI